jgi:hypothetical protein
VNPTPTQLEVLQLLVAVVVFAALLALAVVLGGESQEPSPEQETEAALDAEARGFESLNWR